MAVVTTKSQAITNRDATPRVINEGANSGGGIRGFVSGVAVANGDSVASKLVFGQIPSNAVVHELRLIAPDIGTTTAADFGLYKTTADGGAVVNVSFFKAAQALNAGPYDTDIAGANVITNVTSHKKVYELLGLTIDPSISYDVVATLTGAADAAGSIKLVCKYSI